MLGDAYLISKLEEMLKDEEFKKNDKSKFLNSVNISEIKNAVLLKIKAVDMNTLISNTINSLNEDKIVDFESSISYLETIYE